MPIHLLSADFYTKSVGIDNKLEISAFPKLVQQMPKLGVVLQKVKPLAVTRPRQRKARQAQPHPKLLVRPVRAAVRPVSVQVMNERGRRPSPSRP